MQKNDLGAQSATADATAGSKQERQLSHAEPEYLTAEEAGRYVAAIVSAHLGPAAESPADSSREGWRGMCAFGCYSNHPDRLWKADVEKVAEEIVKCCRHFGVNGWGLLEMPHGMIRAEQVGPLRVTQHYDIMIDETVTRFDMGTCKDGQRVWAGGPMMQLVSVPR